jgi:hypothetical protein
VTREEEFSGKVKPQAWKAFRGYCRSGGNLSCREDLYFGGTAVAAGLAIEEGNTTAARFKRWQPHPGSHDAVSSGSGRAPAREGDEVGREVVVTAIASLN